MIKIGDHVRFKQSGIYTCIECNNHYDDTDGDLDERMCNHCIDKLDEEEAAARYRKNTSNNEKVMDKIESRMNIGNIRFKREMPIDGTYGIKESLEECLDLAIYLAAKLVEIDERSK